MTTFHSTRSTTDSLTSKQAIRKGIADDGGLFVTDSLGQTKVSIDDLAARFYISKYHMMRRFRAETGYTVHAYLTGKRLALAREQIAAGFSIIPKFDFTFSFALNTR